MVNWRNRSARFHVAICCTFAALFVVDDAQAWSPSMTNRRELETVRLQRDGISSTALFNDRFERDLNERSMRNAQGKGAGGGMAAGAILGGLVLGPFGALFGANIGANLGQMNAVDQARKDEMERLGISQDMLDAAQECGMALQQAMEGLSATQDSLKTQQMLARRLDSDAEDIYEKAKVAIGDGDEIAAKDLLFKRTQVQDKLKKILLNCAEEKKRLVTMEDNVKAIEARALEIESLLQRTVGAKSRQDAGMAELSLARDDPLLQKFKDLGID
uniref:Uncharacterized protein n=1 Tax=Craspedostauros australis TaxID=1486917 RepID=A0A7R9WVD1_9STRA|mmetsp:Transcript_21237/g.59109  ORF Transcript_21237/g.59109 Transcript_21237/m.59109 type:complete len:274 (+) Transcript_21237:119-940(+)|eukprot:CAMPEP_0198133606 /NCGR_PEP_ID=MMETSP1442-20131203/59646_1 /TAXON_ID= /ORGANISM="Craspedostauros australis, Strain CCMP3328" /LENGTH=273 /DNA_ID=CAMNT_0043794731 /DNA_START=485 /DNA_END=1306 /DNA_ORIENTATION=+